MWKKETIKLNQHGICLYTRSRRGLEKNPKCLNDCDGKTRGKLIFFECTVNIRCSFSLKLYIYGDALPLV